MTWTRTERAALDYVIASLASSGHWPNEWRRFLRVWAPSWRGGGVWR